MDFKRHPELRRSKSMLVQSAVSPLPKMGRSHRTSSESSKDSETITTLDSTDAKKDDKLMALKTSRKVTDDAGTGNQRTIGVATFHRRHTSKEIPLAALSYDGDLLKGMKRRLKKDEHVNGTNENGEKRNSGGDLTMAVKPTRNSFQSVTQRVSRMLKVRRAIMPRAGIVTDHIQEEEVLSPEEVIQALPATPRFSSYMSPEAQFALMKGYEDLLHDQISRQHPECEETLKRTKTPHHGVAISEVPGKMDIALRNARKQYPHSKGSKRASSKTQGKESKQDQKGNADEKVSADTRVNAPLTGEVKDGKGGGESSSEQDSSTGKATMTPHARHSDDSSLTPLQNLRRLSLSFPGKQEDDVFSSVNGSAKHSMSSGKSLTSMTSSTPDIRPKLSPRRSATSMASSSSPEAKQGHLPHNKRLVLSYRLESAMDLLDTIKPSSEHALSPRVKVQKSRVRPLADFNHWKEQWSTEFKSNKV